MGSHTHLPNFPLVFKAVISSSLGPSSCKKQNYLFHAAGFLMSEMWTDRKTEKILRKPSSCVYKGTTDYSLELQPQS
jgi:hypothetical protein